MKEKGFSVQRSPFRVGRERVKKSHHEGHEEHEGKRIGLILNFLTFKSFMPFMVKKFFVLKEKRFRVPRSKVQRFFNPEP